MDSTMKIIYLTFLVGVALVAPQLKAEMSEAEFVQKCQEGQTLCYQVHDWIECVNAAQASGRNEDAIPFLLKCQEAMKKVSAIDDQLATDAKLSGDNALQSVTTQLISKSQMILFQLKEAYARLGLHYESDTIVTAPTPAPVTEEASSTTPETWTDVLGYSHPIGE